MRLDQLLSERRDAIVRRFTAELQKQGVPPPGTSRTSIVDHIPSFLDEVVDDLRGQPAVRDGQDVSDVSATARSHGTQRWDLGFDLDALVREYGVLRHCILMEAREAGLAISIDEFDQLAKSLNVGVAEAVSAYARERAAERAGQEERFQFLAEAGRVLASSLDSQATLTRLTRLVIPRLADWCAIHLLDRGVSAELPVAHVDAAKTALVADAYRRVSWPADAPSGHPHVISTGVTERVFDAHAPGAGAPQLEPQLRAQLEALGTTSWLIVPLRVQRATFGAITLAYADSGRYHQPADVLLAEDLANRAAVAIENAQLFELANRERTRVETATRAKDEFVAMISHELRTPLNAILGWSRMLQQGLPAERHSHAIDVIERNAVAQERLIGDLLDVSKVISGTVAIDPEPVDLRAIVAMALEGLRPGAAAKGVTIVADLDGADASMRGDAGRLQQVVWNLLTNALKFTPKGGRVTLTLRGAEASLELVVADTGMGIAAEFLPHMFESFRQSDAGATRAHGGLGVGLAIARHLVALHGGTLEGSSEGAGQGARFVMRVPRGALTTAAMGEYHPSAMRERRGTSLPQGLEGLAVLLVDDEEDARELLQVVLESCGVSVRLAPSADAALEQLQSFQPDVIISDIGMPGEDGYSFIRKLRASTNEAQQRIPAIALTAYATAEDRSRALLAGFNLHATKPADPAALMTMVADLAGRHTSHQDR